MKAVFALSVLAVLVIGYVEYTEAELTEADWARIVINVVQKLQQIFKTDRGNIELFGRGCRYSVKGQISKFKWTYKGEISCPGWTGITGNARTKSKKGAVENAMRDFVNKIRNAGLVSEEDARRQLGQ